MDTAKLAAPLLVLLALVHGTVPAWAAKDKNQDCTAITALPAVITLPGVYCFSRDLSTAMTTGDAINIQANDVVLNLEGFKLDGLAAGPGTEANGIQAAGRQNVTIRNGRIRGFAIGITLAGIAAQDHLVEDIRADQNTRIGIRVNAAGSIVRNNVVVATGGSTLAANVDATGIEAGVGGDGTRVLNNDVIDTVKVGTAEARGIHFSFIAGGLAVNNRITGADVGVRYTAATGKFRDNVTFGVTAPFVGGTDIGNNN